MHDIIKAEGPNTVYSFQLPMLCADVMTWNQRAPAKMWISTISPVQLTVDHHPSNVHHLKAEYIDREKLTDLPVVLGLARDTHSRFGLKCAGTEAEAQREMKRKHLGLRRVEVEDSRLGSDPRWAPHCGKLPTRPRRSLGTERQLLLQST